MDAVEKDGEWQTKEVLTGQPVQDLQGARSHGEDRRLRVDLRRSRHAVRHDDQPLEPGQGDAPHQRVEPVQRVHVRRRLGLQPGVAEPDEVLQPGGRLLRRARRFRHACDVVITAQEMLVDNCSYPTPAIAAELLQVPAARPGLREPRRAPDGGRRSVRLGRGPRVRRRDHVAHVRRGVPAVLEGRRGARALRRLRAQPRGLPRGHRHAPPRGLRSAVEGRPGGALQGADGGLGRGARIGHAARLQERPGHRPRADRHDRLHDGLRHDRRRAGPRARQVQEARRRRHDQDRQPDRAAGAEAPGLLRAKRSTRSSTTSTRRARSRARRTSSPSTCPSSTARSAR